MSFELVVAMATVVVTLSQTGDSCHLSRFEINEHYLLSLWTTKRLIAHFISVDFGLCTFSSWQDPQK